MAATATSSRPIALASSAKVIFLAFLAVKRVWQTVGRRGAREVWREREKKLVWRGRFGGKVGVVVKVTYVEGCDGLVEGAVHWLSGLRHCVVLLLVA